LQIADLHITHYKNLRKVHIQPDARFNYVVGDNGMGKTNLLDAIYYLAFGRSYFTSSNADELILFEEDFLRIETHLVTDTARMSVVAKMPRGGKRIIEHNKQPVKQITEHIGIIPVVFITPDDGFILLSASAERRRWMDRTLSMKDQSYLRALKGYNKLLRQRNALLKSAPPGQDISQLLETYDIQMVPFAQQIFKIRKQFTRSLLPYVLRHYQEISLGREDVTISYQSQLSEASLHELAKANYQTDRMTKRTGKGIHKDDLVIEINGRPIKRFASQGQLKSFVLSLKMAQYQFLSEQTGKRPILLIDDIFAKLDASRVQSLLEFLRHSAFGQVFITDTDTGRMRHIFGKSNGDGAAYKMNEGELQSLSV